MSLVCSQLLFSASGSSIWKHSNISPAGISVSPTGETSDWDSLCRCLNSQSLWMSLYLLSSHCERGSTFSSITSKTSAAEINYTSFFPSQQNQPSVNVLKPLHDTQVQTAGHQYWGALNWVMNTLWSVASSVSAVRLWTDIFCPILITFRCFLLYWWR